MPSNQERDTLSTRLSQILIMFNEGKRLSVEELAIEFNVNKRTIQRDFTRLSYLPIEKKDGYYFMEEYCLGRLSYKDIRQFATFSGIQELYPELNNSLIVDILNTRINQTMEVKGHKYEDLSKKVDTFNGVATAIVTKREVSFTYKEKPREVKPYKLINTNGIWYLIAVEGDVVKHFSLGKIECFQTLDVEFTVEQSVIETLKQNDGMWVSQSLIDVVLEIDLSMAEFFLRRDLLPNQKLIEHRDDKLILSTQVAYEEEILKVVRYWIPHMKILSPLSLQKRLENTLKSYLNV